jgi:hypothetical protein
MRLRFMIGGIASMISIRMYNSCKYDPKDVDEIIKLNLHVD